MRVIKNGYVYKLVLMMWSKYISNPNRKNSIIILSIGTIVLVVLINVLAYIAYYSPLIGHGSVRQWNLLLTLEQPVDTLILGDSSGAYGVLPDVVEEVLGGSAINLCTDGQSAPLADPWMLSTYIEKYGVPDRVILVRTPLTYTRDTPLDCVARIPMPWKFWE